MLSSPLAAPRLVGREDEVAFLLRLLEDALSRPPGTVAIVDGDAGIGKARLLAELLRRAADFGAQTITVQAFEQVRDPYAPLVIGIARDRSHNWRDRRASQIRWGRARRRGSATQSKAARGGCERVPGHFARAPRRIIFRGSSLGRSRDNRLTRILVDRALGGAVFVASTLRPHAALADLREKLRGAVHTVRLGPLDAHLITAIVREALRGRGSLGADRVRRITELAGGNPLFALELLRKALAGGEDTAAPSLAYPILGRLARLDAIARQVLEVASAVGSIEPPFIARLQACTRGDIEDALERAQRYALVVRDPVSADWRFAHALTRAAIEAQIGPRRRAAMHRAIGELLEHDELTVDAARLAYHWTFADDPERTLRYNEAAADRATELHDYAAAMRLIEAAIATAPADLAVTARLNEKLADAAMIEASPSRARTQIDTALHAYAALGDRV